LYIRRSVFDTVVITLSRIENLRAVQYHHATFPNQPGLLEVLTICHWSSILPIRLPFKIILKSTEEVKSYTMAPSATDKTARDSLTARILPQMTLSNGDESSMTGPPAPMPHYLKAEGRARLRFEVEGNAMYSSPMNPTPK
jgi:hypothetical protein